MRVSDPFGPRRLLTKETGSCGSCQILAVVLAFTAALSLRQVNAGAGTRQPQKWALMVGVNDYVAERIPDLRGCRNDVELMKSVLVQKYAFPENHIRLLFDRDATKERILAEMDNWLVKQAKPGDVVVFHFSGHGSQAPNDNPNEDPEEDRLDETICPSDIRTDRAFRDVRDDELGAVLAKLSQTHLTVILDCCHSGTGTRALGEIDDLVSPFKIPADADGKPLTTLTRYIYRPEMFDGQQEAPASENSIAGMLRRTSSSSLARVLPGSPARAPPMISSLYPRHRLCRRPDLGRCAVPLQASSLLPVPSPTTWPAP